MLHEVAEWCKSNADFVAEKVKASLTALLAADEAEEDNADDEEEEDAESTMDKRAKKQAKPIILQPQATNMAWLKQIKAHLTKCFSETGNLEPYACYLLDLGEKVPGSLTTILSMLAEGILANIFKSVLILC